MKLEKMKMNPFESIENYMNAVWNENLSDSYTNCSYGFSKYEIFEEEEYFNEFRIVGISPYKAMLEFNNKHYLNK